MQIFRCLLKTCRSRGRHLLGIASNLPPKWTKSWRKYSTCPEGMKVTICGAAGATGQPLALLLKQCPLLDEIALYDICATCGYGMELSHVDTKCKVSSFSGRHMLCDALKGSKVVVIVARNTCDTFENSAPIITEITLQICNMCPSAFVIVGTEPVESMVPLVGEIQRLRGSYNPRALLGCVELNCVRANTVLADFLRVPPESVRVPVIGGATPQTMVPVLSAAVHPCIMTQEQIECVTSCIMSGNEAVCAAKGCCTETACLAGAYAVARTTINVVKGLQGKKLVQCAYVDSMGTCAPDCQFFASEVQLGPSGVEKNLGIPELTKFENCLLCNCLPYVRNEIARAICLVYAMCTSCCCTNCYVHPCTCFSPPVVPCVPPVNWTCDCPDACRDEYLASGKKLVQCAYVDSMGTCAPDCQFFASEVQLGPSGVEKNLGIPELTKFENCLLCNCLPYVRNEIARAICLVYAMCTSCCCTNCYVHPCTCFSPPVVPCVPPVNWTCDCPDACRDEYLASICRDMTCQCGSTELCWRPRDVDYDAARAANLTHQMPLKSCACSVCRVPRSVQIEQKIREKAMDPCKL